MSTPGDPREPRPPRPGEGPAGAAEDARAVVPDEAAAVAPDEVAAAPGADAAGRSSAGDPHRAVEIERRAISADGSLNAAPDVSDVARNARIEDARPEVGHPSGDARVPGVPAPEYSRLPTGPVGVSPMFESGPDTGPTPLWEPDTGERPSPPAREESRLAPWALLAAVVALVASFFVGWGIPVAIVAVIAAIMSLRRPVESRAMACWALVLGILAIVYSLGWLIWAATQFEAAG